MYYLISYPVTFKYIKIMKIVGKKDYYDFVPYKLYGTIDEKIILIRKNLTRTDGLMNCKHEYLSDIPFGNDITITKKLSEGKYKFSTNKVDNFLNYKHELDDDKIFCSYIRVGFNIFKYTYDFKKCILTVETHTDTSLKYNSLYGVKDDFVNNIDLKKDLYKNNYGKQCYGYAYSKKQYYDDFIPIFEGSYITSTITPELMYQCVYDWLLNKTNVHLIDSRNNVQHIESNGFDKKISFRGK